MTSTYIPRQNLIGDLFLIQFITSRNFEEQKNMDQMWKGMSSMHYLKKRFSDAVINKIVTGISRCNKWRAIDAVTNSVVVI